MCTRGYDPVQDTVLDSDVFPLLDRSGSSQMTHHVRFLPRSGHVTPSGVTLFVRRHLYVSCRVPVHTRPTVSLRRFPPPSVGVSLPTRPPGTRGPSEALLSSPRQNPLYVSLSL